MVIIEIGFGELIGRDGVGLVYEDSWEGRLDHTYHMAPSPPAICRFNPNITITSNLNKLILTNHHLIQ